MTAAAIAPTPPPAAPTKSLGAWGLDLLVWGGIAAVLIGSFDAVDLKNILRIFTNSSQISTFAQELIKPDFSNWKLLVGQMWQTIQIALWGTFIAVFLAIECLLVVIALRWALRSERAAT